MFKISIKLTESGIRYNKLYKQSIKDNLEIYQCDDNELFYINKVGERFKGHMYAGISFNYCLDAWYSPDNIDDRNYRKPKEERESYIDYY